MKEKNFKNEEILKKMAEKGDKDATELCGLLYELNILDSDGKGIGRREDQTQAKKMYKRAADAGSPTAQISFAKLLMAKNPESDQAEKYIKLAADKGFFMPEHAGERIKAIQKKLNLVDAGHALVVDDNRTERDMICGIINKRGYKVLAADNGEEALTILKKNKRIALVILDINMPVMNGIDFLRAIRDIEHYSNLAVLVTSFSNEKQHVIDAKRLGISGWMVKPLEIKKLDQFLETIWSA